MKGLLKTKTFWTALAALITALGAYMTDQIDGTTMIGAAFAAVGMVTTRDAIRKVIPALLCVVLLAGCGTTGGQDQETRANQVDQKQWGGLFGKYEGGIARPGKRTVKTTAPSGQVDAEGNPIMISVEIDEESAGPLVLNLGTLNANQEQGTQGEQTGSGTQGKTDTATPTTTVDTAITPPQ